MLFTSHLWRWCNTQVVGLCRWGLPDPPDRWPPCCWKWASPQQRAQGAGNAPPPAPAGHTTDPTGCWKTLAYLGWATSVKQKTMRLEISGNWYKYCSCVYMFAMYLVDRWCGDDISKQLPHERSINTIIHVIHKFWCVVWGQFIWKHKRQWENKADAFNALYISQELWDLPPWRSRYIPFLPITLTARVKEENTKKFPGSAMTLTPDTEGK